ncbi:MAG: tRNA uridine-5-carboxymethylaminomethyl(34) synthesis GTPase MnmE [Chlamydiota bacterium]|nr:tRNA uridine-5-carboxymethylaminomethyl(34) synthesis GTPase MnmE [Chlamydiota bacterium]
MDFSQQTYIPGETVAAIATPPGEGGVAIIRISGKNARSVTQKVYSRPIDNFKSHTVHYGHIIDSNGASIDDVLLIPMLGKKSFTGEDTYEIHCHGGSLITRRVLDVVLNAGARAALPGEFSFKAYMNGKIDLAQAEAIQELIAAKNDRALDAAEAQLQGRLSNKVSSFQKKLIEIAAILEAWVDFPEEGLEFASLEDVCKTLESVNCEIQALIDTFHDGRIIHNGIALCLVGSPNVGKSSLMNALLDKERAIVSHIPGTTRDIVEDTMRLNGMNFRLIDTAGIRQAAEEIEEEGIRRSHGAMATADLILLVLDSSQEVSDSELELIKKLPKEKTIAVWNKSDLIPAPRKEIALNYIVDISAKKRLRLDSLHQMIDSVIWDKGPPSKEEIIITNIRHKESLENAAKACSQLIYGLQSDVSPEFLSMDMRSCLTELGKIIGMNIGEDILSAIFSKFCIGK